MNKDSKIYVAGHTGLLGTAILKKLKEKGFNSIITRLHSELDLMEKAAVMDFFKENLVEYLFLAAGKTGGIMANKTYPATFFHVNIAIQDNLFEAAIKYGVRKLIFYGSSCVYPKNSSQPMKEEYLFGGEIEETSEAYAAAKIGGIVACKAYNSQFEENKFIALVPNSMYGPQDSFDLENSHVLSALIRKFHNAKTEGNDNVILWGSGNPRREFVFSEDVADASVFVMENSDKMENRHYNIGTGIDYSIKELAETIAATVGFEGKIKWDRSQPDGTARKLLDSTRFQALGWKPQTTLKKGLDETYRWFLENIAVGGA